MQRNHPTPITDRSSLTNAVEVERFARSLPPTDQGILVSEHYLEIFLAQKRAALTKVEYLNHIANIIDAHLVNKDYAKAHLVLTLGLKAGDDLTPIIYLSWILDHIQTIPLDTIKILCTKLKTATDFNTNWVFINFFKNILAKIEEKKYEEGRRDNVIEYLIDFLLVDLKYDIHKVYETRHHSFLDQLLVDDQRSVIRDLVCRHGVKLPDTLWVEGEGKINLLPGLLFSGCFTMAIFVISNNLADPNALHETLRMPLPNMLGLTLKIADKFKGHDLHYQNIKNFFLFLCNQPQVNIHTQYRGDTAMKIAQAHKLPEFRQALQEREIAEKLGCGTADNFIYSAYLNDTSILLKLNNFSRDFFQHILGADALLVAVIDYIPEMYILHLLCEKYKVSLITDGDTYRFAFKNKLNSPFNDLVSHDFHHFLLTRQDLISAVKKIKNLTNKDDKEVVDILVSLSDIHSSYKIKLAEDAKRQNRLAREKKEQQQKDHHLNLLQNAFEKMATLTERKFIDKNDANKKLMTNAIEQQISCVREHIILFKQALDVDNEHIADKIQELGDEKPKITAKLIKDREKNTADVELLIKMAERINHAAQQSIVIHQTFSTSFKNFAPRIVQKIQQEKYASAQRDINYFYEKIDYYEDLTNGLHQDEAMLKERSLSLDKRVKDNGHTHKAKSHSVINSHAAAQLKKQAQREIHLINEIEQIESRMQKLEDLIKVRHLLPQHKQQQQNVSVANNPNIHLSSMPSGLFHSNHQGSARSCAARNRKTNPSTLEDIQEKTILLQRLLELDIPDSSICRKYYMHALLLTTAQLMEVAKHDKGNIIFDPKKATQFRNAIYHGFRVGGSQQSDDQDRQLAEEVHNMAITIATFVNENKYVIHPVFPDIPYLNRLMGSASRQESVQDCNEQIDCAMHELAVLEQMDELDPIIVAGSRAFSIARLSTYSAMALGEFNDALSYERRKLIQRQCGKYIPQGRDIRHIENPKLANLILKP